MKKNKDWLAHFKTIDEVKPEIIRDCLLKAKIDTNAKFPSWYRKIRKHAYLCDLERAISIIIDNFEKEIREYEREKVKENFPYLKDCVVQVVEIEGGENRLGFHIRLHHATKPGNIYYGLDVTRPNECQFILKY